MYVRRPNPTPGNRSPNPNPNLDPNLHPKRAKTGQNGPETRLRRIRIERENIYELRTTIPKFGQRLAICLDKKPTKLPRDQIVRPISAVREVPAD